MNTKYEFVASCANRDLDIMADKILSGRPLSRNDMVLYHQSLFSDINGQCNNITEGARRHLNNFTDGVGHRAAEFNEGARRHVSNINRGVRRRVTAFNFRTRRGFEEYKRNATRYANRVNRDVSQRVHNIGNNLGERFHSYNSLFKDHLQDLLEAMSTSLKGFPRAIRENLELPIILAYQIYSATSYSQIVLAIYVFAKGWCLLPSLEDMTRVVNEQLKKYFKVFSDYVRRPSPPGLQHQSKAGVIADSLAGAKVFLQDIFSSELMQSCRDMCAQIISYGIGQAYVTEKFIKRLGPPTGHTPIDLAQAILRCLESIFRFAHNMEKGNDVLVALNPRDPVSSFMSECRLLENMQDLTYNGLPVPGKVSRVEYAGKLDDVMSAGEQLLKSLPRKDSRREAITMKMQSASIIKTKITTWVNSSTRPTPIAFVITGMPGIGKGMILEYLTQLYCTIKGVPYSQSLVYHRNQVDDYWSGYDNVSQPVIHYSEPGALRMNIAKARGDPSMQEILSICDNMPFPVNMAALEDKGKVYATPDMVLLDCNDSKMNLDVIVNNPAAVRRRFIYITPRVLEEFTSPNSCQLDQAKSLASDKPIMDRWTFDVHTQKALNNDKSSIISHLENGDVYALTEVLSDMMVTHFVQQEERLNLTKKIKMADYLDGEKLELPPVHRFNRVMIQLKNVVEVVEGWRVKLTPSEVKDFDKTVESLEAVDGQPQLEHQSLFGFQALYESEAGLHCSVFTDYETYRLNWKFYGVQLLKNSISLVWNILCAIFLGLLLAFTSFFDKSSFLLHLWKLSHIKDQYKESKRRVLLAYYRIIGCFFTDKYLYVEDAIVSPVQKYMPYVTAITICLTAIAFYKTASRLHSQGLTVSRQRTEEEVKTSLEKVQSDSDCQRGDPRPKPKNERDWDSVYIPRPQLPNSLKTYNEENRVVRTIMNNVRIFELIYSDDSKRRATLVNHALGVKGDYALVNVHAFGKTKENINKHPHLFIAYTYNNKGDITSKREHQINPRDIVVLTGDIAMVRLPGHCFADITDYFAAEKQIMGPIGKRVIMNEIVGTATDEKSITVSDVVYGDSYKYNIPTEEGWCGYPLILSSGNSTSVCGIHIAGDNYYSGYALPVWKDLVTTAITKVKSPYVEVFSQGLLRLPLEHPELGNVHERSALNFEELPCIDVYGGLKDYVPMKPKSTLRKTAMWQYAEEITGVSPLREDGKPKFVRPAMTHRLFEGEYVAPYNNFVKKVSVVKKSLNPIVCGKVIDVITQRLLDNIPNKDLKPLPMEFAVNGDPEDFYLRSMKASTSGGFPWSGAKSKHSEYSELPWKKEAFMPILDVQEQVYEMIEAYESEELASPLLGAQLKDEPRSYDKFLKANTRVFCMSPYESTVLQRMYLGPFYTLMCQHSDAFCASLGINMHSTHVDEFVNDMTSFSDKFMEGDYSGYDTSQSVETGLCANTIVYRFLKERGYNDKALRITQGILADNLYPLVVMEGALIRVPSFQPSGKYATAEDNSLRGLVMLVYAWAYICTPYGRGTELNQTDNYSVEDFFKFVKPKLYGDDLLCSVKDEVIDIFNNITYQNACVKLFGIKYTNAQKTSTMEKYLTFDKTSFLKRNFVYREDLGHWVAPLDKDSIMKAFSYVLPSRVVTEAEQVLDASGSSMRELFFHLTEDEFTKVREKFIDRLSKVYEWDVETLKKAYPSFQQIRSSLYGEE